MYVEKEIGIMRVMLLKVFATIQDLGSTPSRSTGRHEAFYYDQVELWQGRSCGRRAEPQERTGRQSRSGLVLSGGPVMVSIGLHRGHWRHSVGDYWAGVLSGVRVLQLKSAKPIKAKAKVLTMPSRPAVNTRVMAMAA